MKREVATSYSTLSAAFTEMGQWDNVTSAREKALALSKEISAARPDDDSDLANVSAATLRLAGIQLTHGDRAESLRNYRRAIEIDQKLAEKTPRDPQRKINLSASYFGLGGAFSDSGDIDAALDAFQKALKMRQELSSADPKDWRTASLYGTTHYRIGLLLTKAGRADKARESLLHAYDIRSNLSQANPSNSGARAEVAEACAALGNLAMKSDRSQALEWFGKADAIYGSLQAQGALSATSTQLRADLLKSIQRAGGR